MGARDQAARCGHGRADLHAVDAAWRSNERVVADEANAKQAKTEALFRTRTGDPLTIPRQLVATDGSGFRLFPPFSGVGDLSPVATPGLHNGSIRERQAQNGKAGRRLSVSGRARSFYT